MENADDSVDSKSIKNSDMWVFPWDPYDERQILKWGSRKRMGSTPEKHLAFCLHSRVAFRMLTCPLSLLLKTKISRDCGSHGGKDQTHCWAPTQKPRPGSQGTSQERQDSKASAPPQTALQGERVHGGWGGRVFGPPVYIWDLRLKWNASSQSEGKLPSYKLFFTLYFLILSVWDILCINASNNQQIEKGKR